jgi:hypothetical protein
VPGLDREMDPGSYEAKQSKVAQRSMVVQAQGACAMKVVDVKVVAG